MRGSLQLLCLASLSGLAKSSSYNFVIGTGDFGEKPTELAHLFEYDGDSVKMEELDWVSCLATLCVGWYRNTR